MHLTSLQPSLWAHRKEACGAINHAIDKFRLASKIAGRHWSNYSLSLRIAIEIAGLCVVAATLFLCGGEAIGAEGRQIAQRRIRLENLNENNISHFECVGCDKGATARLLQKRRRAGALLAKPFTKGDGHAEIASSTNFKAIGLSLFDLGKRLHEISFGAIRYSSVSDSPGYAVSRSPRIAHHIHRRASIRVENPEAGEGVGRLAPSTEGAESGCAWGDFQSCLDGCSTRHNKGLEASCKSKLNSADLFRCIAQIRDEEERCFSKCKSGRCPGVSKKNTRLE